MDQAKWSVPRVRSDRLSKAFSEKDRPRTKVHGIWIHWWELQMFIADPRTASDSDFIIECRARGLERIASKCRERNCPMPTEMVIWADNCVRESKNSWLMAFLCVLILKLKFRFTSLQFSVVGHTHNCLDQLFGQLTIAFRYCHCLSDCEDICASHGLYSMHCVQVLLLQFYSQVWEDAFWVGGAPDPCKFITIGFDKEDQRLPPEDQDSKVFGAKLYRPLRVRHQRSKLEGLVRIQVCCKCIAKLGCLQSEKRAVALSGPGTTKVGKSWSALFWRTA